MHDGNDEWNHAHARVHTHVTAASIVACVIICDSADRLKREGGQTGIVRIREIYPLREA